MNVPKVPSLGPSRQSARSLSRAIVADARLRTSHRKAQSARILAELKASQADPSFDAYVLDAQEHEVLAGLDAESRHYDGMTELFQQLDRSAA
jgi:hypothetical protein